MLPLLPLAAQNKNDGYVSYTGGLTGLLFVGGAGKGGQSTYSGGLVGLLFTSGGGNGAGNNSGNTSANNEVRIMIGLGL